MLAQIELQATHVIHDPKRRSRIANEIPLVKTHQTLDLVAQTLKLAFSASPLLRTADSTLRLDPYPSPLFAYVGGTLTARVSGWIPKS